MKVILFRDNLKNGLAAAEKAVADSANLPILKNILLKTINNRIQLTTTNLEFAITKFISGKIIEEGSLTVPFGMLHNIVSQTTHDRINLEKNNNNFLFKTDNYEANIQGISADEFPLIPTIGNTEHYIEINPVVFQESLQQVVSAAHISEIRPEISGILFDFQSTILKLVATDSFRLAEKIIPANQFNHNFPAAFKAVIPLKTAQELLRVIGREKPLRILYDAHQILFKSDDIEVISRLIDGSYPDYEQIIPRETETEVTVNRAHFMNAVKLVSNFSGKTNDIRLAVKNDQKILDVYSVNQFLGENNYLIPARVSGAVFKDIPFNWRYILDGLKAISEENIIFKINGNTKPALIRPAEDASYLYMVMPIRV